MSIVRVVCISNKSNCHITKTSHKRIQILFFSILITIIVLIFKVLHLSIFGHKNFYSINKSNRTTKIRKDIIDRNGIILASTVPTASAYINPRHFQNTESLQSIAKVIAINPNDLKTQITNKKHFVWLKRHISSKEQQTLHDLRFPGIYFIDDQKRIYPHRNLFSHIIGLVDTDNQGISGIESYFNKDLTNYSNNIDCIQTSLDTRVQYIVRQELNDAIKLHSAVGGVGLVMDVKTGEIISAVSLPDYNPHNIKEVKNHRFFNQATLGVYEMGSILKVFTLAIGIDSGQIDLNHIFDVSTPIQIHKYKIGDYKGGKGGMLSIPEILMYSSNIGVAKIIQKVGSKKQQDYFQKLGMLSKSKIEVPETSPPIIPDTKIWQELRSITISYGHGIAMTPIHLMQSFATILNKGLFQQATLIKNANNKIDGKKVFNTTTSKLMNKILRLSAKKGFAKRANSNQYLVGAKTGTAEKVINGKYDKKLNTALCIAGFPMHNPQYSIFILIDEPQQNKINYGFATGGMVAAPVISNIITKIAPILTITSIDYKSTKIAKDLSMDYKPIYNQFTNN